MKSSLLRFCRALSLRPITWLSTVGSRLCIVEGAYSWEHRASIITLVRVNRG